MLICNRKDKYETDKDQSIYLPTELCYEASLTKDFVKDTRKMRDLDQYKIKNPKDKVDRINQFITYM